MNVKLLRKVQRAILKHPDQFEMNYWFQEHLLIGKGRKPVPAGGCGTAGCIGGWARHIESGHRTLKETVTGFPQLDPISLLDLGWCEANILFSAQRWPQPFRKQYRTFKSPAARARVCARRIDLFIKTKGAK